MTSAAIDDVIARWVAAEQAGDHAALQELTADDFVFVGPLGFLLDKTQWVERYRDAHLRYTRFEVHDTRSRNYGDVTVVVGVQDQEGDYHGRAVDGRFRLTLIVTTAGATPQIAGGHLSPIAAPPAT